MIASVIVDIKNEKLNRIFNYVIPSKLEGIILCGMRVSIPFGYRQIMGFVIEIKEESEYDYNKLKSIIDVLDIVPSLNDELLCLGKSIASTSATSLIKVYETMLPSAIRSTYKKKFILLDDVDMPKHIKNLFQDNELIYSKQYQLYLKDLLKEVKKKNIGVEYIISDKGKKKYVKKISLLDNQVVVRGKKQQEIIDYLISINKDVDKSVLKREINCGDSSIKALINSEIIMEYEEEVYREISSLYEYENKVVTLNSYQEDVYCKVKDKLLERNTFLLYGITGSGKTEIYLNIIEDVLKNGKEAIMLVPEISLTPMMVKRFKGRFDEQVALLHSGLSIGERYDEWRKIQRKEVSVVVGARSAIFAPFTNLGIIIIDEEHEQSYKQDVDPKYHAREIAKMRSEHFNIPLILGSATPSLESFARAQKGVYTLLELPVRANKSNLPTVEIVDMKEEFKSGNKSVFSNRLRNLIEERLQKNEQIILLMNRRGHSTFVMCRECGEVIMCPNCDISLTYHEYDNTLKCHYCGYKENMTTNCPTCGSKNIRYMGIGTQKIEDELHKEFPFASVVRMDADTTRNKGSHETLLYEFETKGDILLGTQMIAKGLDFPRVSLVGVLSADMNLNLPDYRSSEKTFQLLTQVSGRAGRHSIKGNVIIQTYNEDHYAIEYAKNHDYLSFYHHEMKIRKIAGYIPYYNIVQIVLHDKSIRVVIGEGNKIVKKMRDNLSETAIVLGPVLPKIARVNNIYRAQIIIKYKREKYLDYLLMNLSDTYTNEEIKVEIDRNPILL